MPPSRLWQIVFLVFLFNASAGAQQSDPQKDALRPNEMPKPTRDAQAISVLNRAVAISGGIETLAAIRDYRATGTVIYSEQGRQTQGSVTITGNGVARFRLDENLPTGNRSEATDAGNATAKKENGSIRRIRGQTPFLPGGFVLPHRQLVALLRDANVDVSYKGAVQIDGKAVYQVRAERLFPRALDPTGRKTQQSTKDFFIDAVTFQIVMVRDLVPPGTFRQTRYSDFRQVSGNTVPFSIAEAVDEKVTRNIRLDNIVFNIGLQKTDFDLSAR